MKINVYAAKTHLSRLIDRAMSGEDVVITRHGRPVARLVSAEGAQTPRKLGLLGGRVRVAEDFDAPLPADILAGFEGPDESAS